MKVSVPIRSFFARIVIVMMLTSVTCGPVAAAQGLDAGLADRAQFQAIYTAAEIKDLMKSGAVDWGKLSVFNDAYLRGLGITLGPQANSVATSGEHDQQTIADGLLTIANGITEVKTELASPVERMQVGVDNTYGAGLVSQMSSLGYEFSTMTTQPYEATVSLESLPPIDTNLMETAGVSRSVEDPNALVVRGVVTHYTFINTTTAATLDVTVAQPTTGGGGHGEFRSVRVSSPDTDSAELARVGTTIGAEVGRSPPPTSRSGVLAVVAALAVILMFTFIYKAFTAGSATEFRTTGAEPPYYIAVNDGTVVAWGYFPTGGKWMRNVTVPEGLHNVFAIAAGDNHCTVLTTDPAPHP